MTRKELIAEISEMVELIETREDYEEVTKMIARHSMYGNLTMRNVQALYAKIYETVSEDVVREVSKSVKEKSDSYFRNLSKRA